MKWLARYEAPAEFDVDHDDLSEVLRDGVMSVEIGENPAGGHWCTIVVAIDAADHNEAIRKGTRAYHDAIVSLPDLASLEDPFRVTVEKADAPIGRDLLSTTAVAGRLGVSDARVRQLAQRPDFPRPLNIPGLAGAVYSTAAIDAWAATWDRDAKGGRPRKTES